MRFLLKDDYANKDLIELTVEEEKGFYKKLENKALEYTNSYHGLKMILSPSFWLSSKSEAEYFIDLTKKYHKIEALEKIYQGDTVNNTVKLTVCYEKPQDVQPVRRQRRRR